MGKKIYTGTGDSGETSLFGGERVPKSSPRVEAYGTVDELNAVIALCRSFSQTDRVKTLLREVQRDLFRIGTELATGDKSRVRPSPTPPVDEGRVRDLEEAIDSIEKELPRLDAFILPGGGRAASLLHVARTVCRRAERRAVALLGDDTDNSAVLKYLNRLSDLLFVLARLEAHEAGEDEVVWRGGSE